MVAVRSLILQGDMLPAVKLASTIPDERDKKPRRDYWKWLLPTVAVGGGGLYAAHRYGLLGNAPTGQNASSLQNSTMLPNTGSGSAWSDFTSTLDRADRMIRGDLSRHTLGLDFYGTGMGWGISEGTRKLVGPVITNAFSGFSDRMSSLAQMPAATADKFFNDVARIASKSGLPAAVWRGPSDFAVRATNAASMRAKATGNGTRPLPKIYTSRKIRPNEARSAIQLVGLDPYAAGHEIAHRRHPPNKSYVFPESGWGWFATLSSQAAAALGKIDNSIARFLTLYGVPAAVYAPRVLNEAAASWRGLRFAKELGSMQLSRGRRFGGKLGLLAALATYAAQPASIMAGNYFADMYSRGR